MMQKCMVLKLCCPPDCRTFQFENDVEMYGAQALRLLRVVLPLFENDVEMYGAQAVKRKKPSSYPFENDVEMYGAQAYSRN